MEMISKSSQTNGEKEISSVLSENFSNLKLEATKEVVQSGGDLGGKKGLSVEQAEENDENEDTREVIVE